MAEPSGTVFISYAREDAGAAHAIADALRGLAVDVWLDTSELRGGEAWEATIRGQIRGCVLFVALVSANTEARMEGYFRREWKLAIERSRGMADGMPFLVPVAIGGAFESFASVPEEFRSVHWLGLSGDLPAKDIATHLREALASRRQLQSTAAGAIRRAAQSPPTARPERRTPAFVRLAGAAAVLGALALGVYAWRDRPITIAPRASPVAADSRPAIAVLPFADMSPGRDQQYLADGIAEELLNLLVQAPQLRVISRNSTFSFKNQPISTPELAARLNVGHVLEGSIRKSGARIRVTAQLVDARSDTPIWSQSWDRRLDDIFAVQSEIAAEVVARLRTNLLTSAARAKVVNPEAFALFLQARQLAYQANAESWRSSNALYEQALAKEPGYAAAWDGLAANYINETSSGLRPIPAGVDLARQAVLNALAADPTNSRARSSLGWIAMTFDGDLAAAARHYAQALALAPNDVDILRNAGTLAQYLGRLDVAVAIARYVVAQDPLNPSGYHNLGIAQYYAGRPAEAIASLRTALRLAPGRTGVAFTIGTALLEAGEQQAALSEMQGEPAEIWRLIGLAIAYHALGRGDDAAASLARLTSLHEREAAYNIAYVLAYRGEIDRAFEWLDKAVAYGDTGLGDAAIEPLFARIRRDPRWPAFLEKIGRSPGRLAEIPFNVELPQ